MSVLGNASRRVGPSPGWYPCQYTPPAQTSPLWILRVCKQPQPVVTQVATITFTLVVDNFGVKYVSQDDIDHLIASIKAMYTLTKDWTGDLYCGIKLDWDHKNRTINISMPGYIKRNCRNMST
jgi:hypothetical protein